MGEMKLAALAHPVITNVHPCKNKKQKLHTPRSDASDG